MEWLILAASVATLILVLGVLYRPVGDYMAWSLTSRRDLKVERGIYRVIGVDPASDQSWPAYLRSVLVFSALGVLLLFVLQRTQQWLPYALDLPAVPEGLAFNTAISFVTNTNWQAYSPELTLGYTAQFAGLTVQNFVSAATGIAVAVAFARGFAYRRSGTIGNFWVDLVRTSLRILLPLAVIGAVVLLAGGVIQNFAGFQEYATVTGGTGVLPGGPVASQEAIKEIGTNGGGFFNVNASHPFENPSGWTSMFQLVLILVIPFSLPRTFGRIVNDDRQGYAIVGAMRGALLSALSHDLRRPLAAATAAVGGLRTAGSALSPDDRGELLETADESRAALSVLVTDLLDVSRLQAGALGIQTSVLDAADVIVPALDELSVGPREVELDLDAAVPPLQADGVLLQRAVVNLLANALRYSPEGTAPRVAVSAFGERVEIRVIDHGPGIPEDRRSDVFLPFQRLGDTDNTTGLGLGLALSKGFVEAMGGTLVPEDTPGGGLTMVVSLPAASAPGLERARDAAAPREDGAS